ncbi:MAG: signal peptidase I [Alphaproteobacteria bacterium]|nr:signal peptidase I [Alphaproteobacteria bacterium]
MALGERRLGQHSGKGGILETVKTIVYAVLIALVIRTVGFEPFSIPSESMLPTLLVGDYLFVSKYAYGYSRHSMPFSPPVGGGRVLESQPERGDIAVFKLPRDGSTDYIKRVIGLPGDRIQVKQGLLHINDRPIERVRIDDFIYAGPDARPTDADARAVRVPRYRETLPNGVSYVTLDFFQGSDSDDTEVVTVPKAHYFMMGDNRDRSCDSRVPREGSCGPGIGGVGFVPAENLVGRAEILFFSKLGNAWIWNLLDWRLERFLNSVRPSRTVGG